VAIANGRYFGGGMLIAPTADPTDGLFDVVQIEAQGFLKTLALAPMLYKGKLREHPRVQCYRTRRLTIESPAPVLLDVDGEPGGRVPVTLEICPSALRMHLP
jgi:diacylglycerol kinase family enzyme